MVAPDASWQTEEREGARVLVVDADDRVLLLLGSDPGREDTARAQPERPAGPARFWFTPGGGLEPGEPPAVGAVRELVEETGLRVAPEDLVGPVWERVADFPFLGRWYRQHELFYLLRVGGHDVAMDGITDLERRTLHGHRWWSFHELRTTDEAVYPVRLADELERLLDAGPPPRPRWLG